MSGLPPPPSNYLPPSGVSALNTGADSVHIFCEVAAANVIRSFSPSLVIHPVLDQEYGMEEVDAWLPRLDCVVIGPGLGRNQSMLGRISLVLKKIVSLSIPVIIDGDGLWHLVNQPSTLAGYRRAVITPNTIELNYLYNTFCGPAVSTTLSQDKMCTALSLALGKVLVVSKGPVDRITCGEVSLTCSSEGSPRRCDGQGHILAGVTATFIHWAVSSSSSSPPVPASSSPGGPGVLTVQASITNSPSRVARTGDSEGESSALLVVAGWAACHLVRNTARTSFTQRGRAQSAQHITESLGTEFQRIFEGETYI